MEIKRLIFGTSQILRLVFDREIKKLLNCVYDIGIRHFDTARLYGFGEAEKKLGNALRSYKDTVKISTKFGLKFKEPSWTKKKVFLLGRLYKSFFPLSAKSFLNKHAPIHFHDFSLDATKESFDLSLKNLGVERIDYFFLHEPFVNTPISDEILSFLDSLVTSGKIGAFGLSGYYQDVKKIQENLGVKFTVNQFASNIFNNFQSLDNGQSFCFNVVKEIISSEFVKKDIFEKKIDLNFLVACLLGERLEKCCFQKVLFNSTKINTVKSVVQEFLSIESPSLALKDLLRSY